MELFLLWFLFSIVIFGFWGGNVAAKQGREPVAWFFVCGFLGVLGIVILLTLSPLHAPASPYSPPRPGVPPRPLDKRYDTARWQVLTEVDADIAAAVARIRPAGNRYVDLLAEKYLALNDKTYLQALVEKVEEIAAAEAKQSAPNGPVAAPLADFTTIEARTYGGSLYQVSAGGLCRIFRESDQCWVYFESEEALKAGIRSGSI